MLQRLSACNLGAPPSAAATHAGSTMAMPTIGTSTAARQERDQYHKN
jgi:hypothetical protein